MANINFKVGFDVDKRGLDSAKKDLEKIQSTIGKKGLKLGIDEKEIQKAKNSFTELERALDKALDTDTGVLNIRKLNSELKKNGTSLTDLQQTMKEYGVTGVSAFQDIQREAMKTGTEIKKTKGFIDEMADTIVNTAKWNVASGAVNTLTNSIQRAVGFVKALDNSLTQIRIVTGKSSDEMKIFSQQANEAAKALGRSTTEYTDASLIFFQQGKSAEEVKALTEATLVGANVTGMEAAETAEMLTAVMNGYQLEASKAMEVTDKLAAVGAATGSDFEEMATAMSKVASQAANAGVSIDQLGGMISTVSTVTREAPEVIGTSFKTILGRLADLRVGKEAEGWDTGQVEQALNKVGMSVLDQNGKLKESGDILTELGTKWNDLSAESQVVVAKQIAGLEQYNRLISLMENWTMYEDALAVSQDSAGAAMEQNAIRMDSIDAKLKNLRTEAERLYMALSDEDMTKGAIDAVTFAVGQVANLVEGLGGLQGVMASLIPLALSLFNKSIGEGITNSMVKLGEMKLAVKDAFDSTSRQDRDNRYSDRNLKASEKSAMSEAESNFQNSGTDLDKQSLEIVKERIKLRQQEEVVAKNLNEVQLKQFQNAKDTVIQEQEKLKELIKQREERTRQAKANVEEHGMGLTQKSVSMDIEKQNAQIKAKNDLLAKSRQLYEAIQLSNDRDIATIINGNSKLNERQATIKKIMADQKLLDSLRLYELEDYDNIDQLQDAIAEAIAEQKDELKEVNKELENSKQLLEDIKHVESSPADMVSEEEKQTTKRIQLAQEEADKLEQRALKQEKLNKLVAGIGVGMSALNSVSGAMKVLGDETATTEEKVNALSANMLSLGGTLMASGNPYLMAAGLITTIGSAAVKAIHELNPMTQTIKRNTKILEESNKALDESRKRTNALNDARAALNEAKQMQDSGINANDTEAMERYTQLQNEIAANAPQLVSYYDEEGNAIVNLNGNIDDLIEKEKQLQREAHSAMAANRKGFADEYNKIINDQQAKIDAKQRILDTIEKEGSYNNYNTGESYGKDDIGTLTTEIENARAKIQETKQDIATNIINPIYGASEAYSKLSAENQKFARGLIDVGRVSDHIQDPTRMERYSNIVSKYMDNMVANSSEINNKIDETKAKLEELKSTEGADKSQIQKLEEELVTLNTKLTETAQGPLKDLMDVEKANIMEIASLFDINDEKLDNFLAKLATATGDATGLSTIMAQGGLDATELSEQAGMRTSLSASADVMEAQSRIENLEAEREKLTELKWAYDEVQNAKLYGLEIDQETQYLSEQYLSNSEAIAENRRNMLEAEEASNSAKLEQLILQREEAELQEQLNEQYWANVDALLATTEGYNELADAYNSSVESIGNIDELQESLNEAFASKDISTLMDSLDDYADKIPGLGYALQEMADGSEDGFNRVKDIIDSVAEQQGRMYAKMRGTDTAYWNEFTKRNKNQTALIEYEYGVRASDYSNYQEYEQAINLAAEKGKRRNLDETTRNAILNYNEEELAKWQQENNMLAYNAESNQKQAANTANSASSQAMTFSALRDAGFTIWQSLAISIANIWDGIVNGAIGAVNSGIGMVNGAIQGVSNVVNGFISGINNMLAKVGELPGVPTVQLPKVSFGSIPTIGKVSNTAGALMNKFSPSSSSKPNFNFDYGAGNNTIGKKPGGGGGSRPESPGPGNTGPGVGGGSGGSGGKKPSGGKGSGGKGSGGKDSGGEDVEDMEWERDIYHDINAELERKDKLLSQLQKQQDKLYGKELLDNLAKQKKLLQDQQKLYEQKLALQKQDAKNQADSLKSQGVKIDDATGMVLNYNDIIQAKVNAANKLSGEEKEEAIEKVEEFIEAIENYEELVNETIWETQEAIQDTIDAQKEIFLQEFDYKIQIQMELSDDFQKALDFQKELNKDFEDSSENMEMTSKQMLDLAEKAANIQEQINKINNDASLTDKERLERLQDMSEALKDTVKQLQSLDESMTKMFKDALKEGLELIKEHLDAYKDINNELKHMEQMAKLLGKNNDYQFLQSIYREQYDSFVGQIDILQKQKDVLIKQKEALEAAGMKGSDEWKEIDQAIKDTTESVNKLVQDSIKALQNEFKASVDEIMSSLEATMTNNLGFDKLKEQQKELKEERKKYLDTEEKLLAISKLQSKVQKEIDKTDDPSKKAKLQKFLDEEVKKLKEKDKLTKYDVDRANQLYDITMKQMALQDLQASKSVMRLVRDAQGNWVYEFTEDLNAINKAQEDASASLEKLHEMDKKKLQETQEEMLKAQEEYYKQVEKIVKNHMEGKYATEEEFQAALEEATTKFNEKMVDLNAEYEEIKTNTTISSMGVILDVYKNTSTELNGLTESQQAALESMAEKVGGDYQKLKDFMEVLINGDQDSISSAFKDLGITSEEIAGEIQDAMTTASNNAQSEWNTSIGDMISQIAGPGGSLKEESNNAIQSIMDKWAEYQDKVENVTVSTGNDMNSMKDRIEDISTETDALNKKTDDLISTLDKELTAVTKVTTSFQQQRQELQKLIDKYKDYIAQIDAAIKKKKEEATGVTTSGGTSSSGSGSGSKPPSTSTPNNNKPSSGSSGSGGSSSSSAKAPTKGSTVRVKPGRRWYYDSQGMNPSGPTDKYANQDLYVVNTSKNKYQYAVGKTTNINSSLGWLKKEDLVGFDTGGYTGSWGKEGKLAMLHEKEIVLNKQDTSNILDAVKLIRSSEKTNSIANITKAIMETSAKTISALTNIVNSMMPNSNAISPVSHNENFEQVVNINADFSGVRTADEIEKAFANMENMASQYANRTR